MRYAQIARGQKLHLVYEPGEGRDSQHLIPAGHLSRPLCGRKGNYRMTTTVPLAYACHNCLRVFQAREKRGA